MGEAKRRGARPSEPADKLPNVIFFREKAVEKAGGFLLAGRLVTDLPKHEPPSESDLRDVIELLIDGARRDPDMQEASLWLGGGKPADALASPFPEAAMLARVKRCAVVVLRIDLRNDGLMRLDDSLLADIMGRH
jgi:hypothetical protein